MPVDLAQPCSTGEADLLRPCSTGEVDFAQAYPTNKLCSTDPVDWSQPLLSGEADNKGIAVSQDVETYVCQYSISDESVTFGDKHTVHQARGPTESICCDSLYNENIVAEVSSSAKTNALELTGRRILDDHGPFSCKFSYMFVFREVRRGLRSVIFFKCTICNLVSIWQPKHSQDINTKYLMVSNRTALEEMKRAAEKGAKLAVEHGEIDKNGVPILTVVADSSWPKRSFRNNYSSLSGVVSFLLDISMLRIQRLKHFAQECSHQKQFKTIIFTEIIFPCDLVALTTTSGGISTELCARELKMEVLQLNNTLVIRILLEAFQAWNLILSSMGLCPAWKCIGVKYGILIADGDGNVYAKILQARPCDDLTVEKIECTNHILRNYVTKMIDLVENGKLGNVKPRQIIGANILKFMTALRMLNKDLINSPSHIFGEHRNCKEIGYFCSGAKEVNYVQELTAAWLYTRLQKIISGLADHCRSLLKNLTSNVVEQFFSLADKFVGGKRVNYTQKRSCRGRCTESLVSNNTHRTLYLLLKAMCTDKSPGKYTKLHETRRLRPIQKRHTRTRPMRRENRYTNTRHAQGKHYGRNAQKPDLPEPICKEKKHDFLKSLVRTKNVITELDNAVDKGREMTSFRMRKCKRNYKYDIYTTFFLSLSMHATDVHCQFRIHLIFWKPCRL
ncbi:hypothetical protein PR048_002845 [Dryococelus australis]|uniref:Mutator-like transposase domain-containing protein n=1 Tax=Dryococelus australis TaxID=614101 RepID=A0ABQ9ILB7_9NEOP|nr:hypothetical protein PR048_002845 [Dryococelus australis]